MLSASLFRVYYTSTIKTTTAYKQTSENNYTKRDKFCSTKYHTEESKGNGPRTKSLARSAQAPIDKDWNTVASARPIPSHRWLEVKWLNVRESCGMGQPFPQMMGSMGAEPQAFDSHLPHCLVWTTRPHGRRDKGVCQPREVVAEWSSGQFQSSVLVVIFLDELNVPLSKALMN